MSQISFETALEKAMALCSRSEKCISDIQKKMFIWEVCNTDTTKIIDILQKEKFINEKRYAEYYVNDKFNFNKWGKVKIAYMLKGKGIPQAIIQHALNQIKDSDYLDTLRYLLLQKQKSVKSDSNYELNAKLIRFATGRGFEYEAIAKVLDDI